MTLSVCSQDWPDFLAACGLSLAIGAAACYGALHLFGCLR